MFPDTAGSPDDPGFSAKIAGLRHLTHLKSLQLPRNHITDEDMIHLQGLTPLRYLRLEGNEITDAGLASLAELNELRKLRLGANRITDAGLAHLSGLTKLEELHLDRNLGITDAGMKHLATLTKLRVLDVMGTRVSRAGALELHQSIPSEPLIAGAFKPIPRGRRTARRR